MIWFQTVLPVILGLVVVGPFQYAQADNKFFNLKVTNSSQYGRPGNKTHHYGNATVRPGLVANATVRPALADNALYMKYACNGKQNGLRLPIDGSCTQYIECQRGSAKLMTCRRGKHFSTLGLACIDAKLSNCTVKCECCGKQDGIYPDVTNCSNFIVCFEGKTHRQSCGSYFKFDSKHRMCDIPQRARCTSNNTTIDRKIEASSSKTPLYLVSHKVCLNRSNGYAVGVEGSCNKFYLCVNGKGYLKSCGHMQFNAATHYCDSRTRIFCSDNEENFVIVDSDDLPMPAPIPEVPQPPHRVPGKPFPSEQHPSSNGDASHPPVVGKPENNGPDAVPMPPVIVDSPIPSPPVIVVPDVEKAVDPREYAGICADASVGELKALPKHCSKYIRCRWDWYERRVAELESCPKGMHFNAKSKLCDVPEKAGCSSHFAKKHF